MASGDHDDALQYLLSKLQSEDGWSCANLAWNEDRLTVIADQFSNFDGAVKSKLLLSFLAMSPRVIANCRDEMVKLLRLARRDGDEWVRLFAAVLSSFPDHQVITLDADSNASDILEELGETLSTNLLESFVPHEFPYLNNAVLMEHNHTPSLTHFNLRCKPRASSQLRQDVLHRAELDFTQTGSLIRDRMIQRQSSSSTGLMSFGPSQRNTTITPKVGLMQRRHRQKGTKLLEIDEVPMAGRRKRKASDVDGLVKKTGPIKQPTTPLTPSPAVGTPILATPTPDYAVALATEDSSIQPHVPSLYNSTFFSNVTTPSSTTPTTTKLFNVTTTTISSPISNIESSETKPSTSAPPPPEQPPTVPSQQPASVAKQQPKGLKLSRQQLAVAQEIFREAPHLNKQQKALILAFMAGSRDNPLPGHNVISLKLNQKQQQEYVQNSEGESVARNVQLETIFEMNYNTGQWRKLQVKRPIP